MSFYFYFKSNILSQSTLKPALVIEGAHCPYKRDAINNISLTYELVIFFLPLFFFWHRPMVHPNPGGLVFDPYVQ